MAAAIARLWPDAQFAAGPAVENGFYYDVELEHRISPADFDKIEAEMRRLVENDLPFQKIEVTRANATDCAKRGRLAALGDRPVPSKYKLDILDGISGGVAVSLYQCGDFIDLCSGPHVERTGVIEAFKLTGVASAFYKGDESSPQLQRIYGTAFPRKADLDAYFAMLEESKKRDHRKLGRDLELFLLDDLTGPGLVLWQPKGAIIRQELQNFISEELRLQGYDQVFTPHIGNLQLFRTSGHFPYYQESQYPPLVEREVLSRLAREGCSCADLSNRLKEGTVEGFLLKPMNCPMHIRIFASRPRSYRELPVRLAEFGTVYRWEQSGELNGMTRVRGFTQDDAHIFAAEDQLAGELLACLKLVQKVFTTLGMKDYRIRIGLRDPHSDKYAGSPENWSRAENALREAAATLAFSHAEEIGEAAFYGPKIDFVIRDVIGRSWQLGTVQVDYNLPERFDLLYAGADGAKHRPVMIHRAPFGSMERFCGMLIEHYGGAFPVWLAPEQARILPITDAQTSWAREVCRRLFDQGIRVTVDEKNDKIGGKIRNAQLEKIPYMLIVGAREMSGRQVALRTRAGGDEGAVGVDALVSRILAEIRSRQ